MPEVSTPSILQPTRIVLAFDFGIKRIGVAIGNTLSNQARALETIHSEINDVRFGRINELINEWQAHLLVVGKPCHPDGTPHELTHRCTRFANQLHGRFKLPVCLVDERYSSAVAEDAGIEKHQLDAVAAQIILQQFFDEVPNFETVLQSKTVSHSYDEKKSAI